MNFQDAPFSQEIGKLSQKLLDSLRLILASISSVWQVEHTETGTHGDVTVESLLIGDGADSLRLLPTDGSPVAARWVFGDGTGWTLRWYRYASTNAAASGSTTGVTVLAGLDDRGNFATSGGYIQPGTTLRLPDGVTAPSAVVGVAILYVDAADGDLKVVFGDGTVKTIVTDT